MVAAYAAVLLTLLALALLGMGFASIFREEQMRPPGCYFSWGVVSALILCRVVDAPLWVLLGNFVILLFTAWLWRYDLKERA